MAASSKSDTLRFPHVSLNFTPARRFFPSSTPGNRDPEQLYKSGNKLPTIVQKVYLMFGKMVHESVNNFLDGLFPDKGCP